MQTSKMIKLGKQTINKVLKVGKQTNKILKVGVCTVQQYYEGTQSKV